jgi:hypothetical protein
LLSTIAAAISDAMDEPSRPVTVTVEPDPSFREQFDASFKPEEVGAPAAGVAARGVNVKINKIGR